MVAIIVRHHCHWTGRNAELHDEGKQDTPVRSARVSLASHHQPPCSVTRSRHHRPQDACKPYVDLHQARISLRVALATPVPVVRVALSRRGHEHQHLVHWNSQLRFAQPIDELPFREINLAACVSS